MQSFVKELKSAYEIEDFGVRINGHIHTKSGYKMSIQCSQHHYCYPRETIDIDLYSSFELALLFENDFVYPKSLKDFDRVEELEEHYEMGIFLYVPKDLVEDLYNYLNSIEEAK